MESEVLTNSRRGRPRKSRVVQNASSARQQGLETKRRAVSTKLKVYVGRYVKKEFGGSGVFLGKIVYYDSGLYRVDYEDGDCEDLDSSEIRQFILQDDDFSGEWIKRRRKLDQFVSKKARRLVPNLSDLTNVAERADVADKEVDASGINKLSGRGGDDQPIQNEEGHVDGFPGSSSDSCGIDIIGESGLDGDTMVVPPPQLPPSSGTIGIQEEYVSHLFSVYSFLRSFSIRLFLSPFGLDDFVGALNCSVANTLLDSIYVSLLRVLRRHLETLSSDGSQLSSKCLRCLDWSLLDALTWPVYLSQYLVIMGYAEGPDWKGFYADILEGEYYNLSAGKKLMILQILCDDVLDSAELRAEINMREELEIGTDFDMNTPNLFEIGPKKVHPKYPKTSACKDQEVAETNVKSHDWKSQSYSKADHGPFNVDQDANSDECRLCGMDGTLLCCDGCPSAYHSRCIGVAKVHIPEGAWYCPECVMNKNGPVITRGTFLRGAEIFGIDSYGQVFLGTCDYLLVLKAFAHPNEEPCSRYYRQNDIPDVLLAVSSSVQHISYSGICKAISRFWDIPESVFSIPASVENGFHVPKKVDKFYSVHQQDFNSQENHFRLSMPKGIDNSCGGTASTIEPTLLSGDPPSQCEEGFDGVGGRGCISHESTKTPVLSCCKEDGFTAVIDGGSLVNIKISEQMKIEPAMSTGSITQRVDTSDITHQSFADRSSMKDFMVRGSGNSNTSRSGHTNSVCFPGDMSSKFKERGGGNLDDTCVYYGSNYKTHAYINNYSHGDFAASAAANLAVLLSEESQLSEINASSGNPKKAMSANIALQVKAFLSTASRFVWPNSERKLVEVPRERCGWCYTCKAPPSGRRGCMLNSAAVNATKGAMKILYGPRFTKIEAGSLPCIAAYILYMEESLTGLIVGPFMEPSYRRQWRRQVEQATTCSALKSLIIDLEENIRVIAFAVDWIKLVDNWPVECSVAQSAKCTVGTVQKRVLSGRRSKRQSVTSEVTSERCDDVPRVFVWWRGGKLPRLLFNTGVLHGARVKKAARQGGSKKISGIYYGDGWEMPRISRQFTWRAAVEMSRNTSQLAVQVRYLDHHVKWNDLARPDQNLPDGKGPDTEASAFRNAVICDKRVEEENIRYGVAFGKQKHLSSRVMKNIIEVEQSRDGNGKYWFCEAHIPLYLIKEYEQSVEKVPMLSAKGASDLLSKLKRRQHRASGRDVFVYLARRRDKLEERPCASCQLDIVLGNAVRCSACQGVCHKTCTVSSTVSEFMSTCKRCYSVQTFTHNESSNDSPTSPLPLRRREYLNSAAPSVQGGKQKVSSRSSSVAKNCTETKPDAPDSSLATKNCTETKPDAPDSSLATKSRRRTLSWGLIWRKKKFEDTGVEFRSNNILLKGDKQIGALKPVCHLCRQPCNSELMYIQCETCQNWYHADALELEESKLCDLVGFKCCKCRRIKSPKCPYSDRESKKSGCKTVRSKTPKQKMNSPTETISEGGRRLHTSMLPMKEEEEAYMPDDDSLYSISEAEPIAQHEFEDEFEWNTSFEPEPKKLAVRRQTKNEIDVDSKLGNCSSLFESSTPPEPNTFLHYCKEEEASPRAGWDVSANGLKDELLFDYQSVDYEGMEFEPQTYFSFTELLESNDDGAKLDMSGNLENTPFPLQFENGNISNLQEARDPGEPAVTCRFCLRTEPAPVFSCRICGLIIHRHCSPWVESPCSEDAWTCGNCREWR